jgi:ankyrin repeat protein
MSETPIGPLTPEEHACADAETDPDRALWNIVDKEYYKKQPRDAQSCVTDGANVNCLRPMDPYGDDVSKLETPLLVTVYRQNPELVKRLLEMGANLSANTNAYGGRTVLHIAALHNSAEIAGMLIQAGVSMEQKDTLHGWTALHLAVSECRRRHLTVRMLLANGANVNAMDDSGRTPLRLAMEIGGRYASQCKEILIANGADLVGKVVKGSYPEGESAWDERSGKPWMEILQKKERYHSGRRDLAFAMRQWEQQGA